MTLLSIYQQSQMTIFALQIYQKPENRGLQGQTTSKTLQKSQVCVYHDSSPPNCQKLFMAINPQPLLYILLFSIISLLTSTQNTYFIYNVIKLSFIYFLLLYYISNMIKSLKDGAYEYSEKDLLGEGSFASVYRGVITKNGRVVAVRLLPLKLIKQYGNKIKDIIKGEVGVLKDLSYSQNTDSIFMTRIYDCFLTEHNVVMILQFCPEGNLEDVMKGGPLTEPKALEIMLQLARGLEFIAKEKVVHRDIKPDNIFVKSQGNYKVFKLGDFGFAVKKQLNDQIVGTPIFMSPELFREEKYGSQVDVWAFGLMCHYMMFKEYYFIGATEKQIKNRVLKEHYQLKAHHLQKVSPQMADFLTLCLQNDKNKRLPANVLSQHPVFNPVRGKIDQMVADVKAINVVSQSKLAQNTAKGQITNLIMKYEFLSDLGLLFKKWDNCNYATLYIYKYNLGELSALRKALEMRNNVINHPKWDVFVQGPDFAGVIKLISSMIEKNQKNFEVEFNQIIPLISQRYGPQVAQGIQQNLGNGPYDRMNPAIIAHELKTNWFPKLSQNKSQQNYALSLECLLAVSIYEGKNVQFDYIGLQFKKKKISIAERVAIFESALKSSQL